jgi:hypothetical protein
MVTQNKAVPMCRKLHADFSCFISGLVHLGFVEDKIEGKTPLGRPRRRWDDNISMDLREIGCKGVE